MQKSSYHAYKKNSPLEYIYGHQNFPLPITLRNPDDQ